MARPNRPPALRALRQSWRRWTEVVELFANRRPGWHRLDPGAYQSLYRELLEDCRAAEAAADGPGRECCRLLQEIVRPWLNVQALARADALVLLSLADCCRSAGEWLGVRRKPPRAFPRLILVGGALALAAAVVLWRVGGEAVADVRWGFLSWTNPLRTAIESLGDGEKIALVGLVVIGLSLLLVSRTRGSG